MHTLLMSLRGGVEDSGKVGRNRRRSGYLTHFLKPQLPVSNATPLACEDGVRYGPFLASRALDSGDGMILR